MLDKNAIKELFKNATPEELEEIIPELRSKALKNTTEYWMNTSWVQSCMPKMWDKCYCITSIGDVAECCWGSSSILRMREALLYGNCFKTREEAEQEVERRKVHFLLQCYARAHNGIIDWDSNNRPKYFLCYNHEQKNLWVGTTYSSCAIKEVYFTSIALAEAAKEEIGEERLLRVFASNKEYSNPCL